MNRRSFLKTVVALSATQGLASVALATPATPATTSNTTNPFTANVATPPYAQIMGQSTIAVCWQTKTPVVAGLRWRYQDQTAWNEVYPTEYGLIKAETTHHQIHIPRLEAGRTVEIIPFFKPIERFHPYDTRLRAPVLSEVITLHIPKKDHVCFSVFNDLHNRRGTFLALLPEVLKRKPHFVAFNGDYVTDCSTEAGVRDPGLINMCQLTREGIPSLFVRGNHEYRGHMARRLKNYVARENGEFFGAFTAGPVRIAYLDSGEDKEDSHPVYAGLLDCDTYLQHQNDWFAKEVKSPAWQNAAWRIIIIHIPVETLSKDAYGPRRLRELLTPILADAKLDLMIGAHEHRLQRIDPATSRFNIPYPIFTGGGPSLKSATTFTIEATPTSLSLTTDRVEGEEKLSYQVTKA